MLLLCAGVGMYLDSSRGLGMILYTFPQGGILIYSTYSFAFLVSCSIKCILPCHKNIPHSPPYLP